MPAEPNSSTVTDADQEPMSRLLLRLVWELVKLVAPITGVAMLAPYYGVSILALVALLVGLSAKLGWKTLASGMSWLMTASVIGACISLGMWIPGWWGVPLALVLLVIGLASASTYEKYLGLATPALKPEAVSSELPPGSSAWGGADLLTPEDEPIRTFDWGELCMGGPTYGTYLFPDGVLLGGLGSSVRFSSSGRYFAAPLPGRDGWGLLILDRQTRTVYRHAQLNEFWELDDFTDEALSGRCSPLVDNQSYRAPLADLLDPSKAVQLEARGDLWLEPGWVTTDSPDQRSFPAPAGNHRLSARRYFPDSLRELADPTLPLRYPGYRLQMDEELSDLLIDATEPVIWRADGQALVCRVTSLQSETRWPCVYWLWQAGQGWRALPAPWVSAEDEPTQFWEQATALTEQAMTVQGTVDHSYPDHLGFGYQLYSTPSDVDVAIGHNPQGRLQIAEFRRSRVQLSLPLDAEAVRGAASVQSEPLADGSRATFTWLHDNVSGRLGAYACRIGDWALEGEWLLDHRVSDCGRYLALVAFADAPAVPSQVCVADNQQRVLLRLERSLLVARLVDFRGGELSLLQVLGRLSDSERDTPLRRYDQAAPAAERAARFVERVEGSRLYYEALNLQVTEQGLQPLPRWRLVERPQVANADGDFVLPAPTGRDAAWLFGAQSEYCDSYLREGFPRQGGCLLTASGLALDSLGPSMIWSEDGRYLALTRFIERLSAGQQADTDQWHLLLLDTAARTWRDTGRHIGCMPVFERFDEQGIEVRSFTYDWENEEDAGQLTHIALADLLRLHATPLEARGPFWLPSHELARAGQWQRLDTSHLQAWR